MSPTKQIQVTAQLNELHARCAEHAKLAVEHALSIGRILQQVKANLPYGEFTPFLETLSFTRMTATRYMKLAELFDAQASQLTEGKTLSDLYREFGLIAPLAGGGHRSATYQNGESLAKQLELCFNVFDTQLQSLRRVQLTELTKVGAERLQKTRAELEETLAIINSALQPTVPIESEMALLADEKASPGTGEPMTPVNPETPIQA